MLKLVLDRSIRIFPDMAISRFNLHALVDQDEEDDEVVELVRVEPPLAHLLPDPSILFTRFPGHEPSFPRSIFPIQDIPFMRCSASRSCQACNHSACTAAKPYAMRASHLAPGPSVSTSPHASTGHLTSNSDTVPTKCHFRRNKKRRDTQRLLAGLSIPQHQPLCRASSHLNLPLPHIIIW